MRFVRGFLVSLHSFVLLTGCNQLEQALAGEFTLQVGSWTLKVPARGEERHDTIHSGAPAPTFPKRVPDIQRVAVVASEEQPAQATAPVGQSWGSCDSAATREPIASARAELIGLKLVTATGERTETLAVSSSSFDLLRFSSQLSELLSQHALPAGEYSEIRVLVRKAVLVDSQGRRLSLDIPKGETEGIAIRLNRTLLIDAETPKTTVTLTFCTGNNFLVDQSQEKGVRNAFHPVIDKVINLSI